MRSHPRLAGLLLGLVGLLTSAWSRAAPLPVEELERGRQQLEQGQFEQAIAEYERLADRGLVHPDVSFNRAAAYLQRASSPQAQPGDLGRAAAALEETLLLRPDDTEAGAALDGVRRQIARRLARSELEAQFVRPRLGRALVGALSENTWLLLAALGSLLATLGLVLWRWSRRSTHRFAGGVLALFGGLALGLFGLATAFARHQREHTQPAVVVAPQAQWLDAAGAPLPEGAGALGALPEGAAVLVLETQGSRAKVEWGDATAWVALTQLRRIGLP